MNTSIRITSHVPLPLGELLNSLSSEGFSVTPDTYNRLFLVVSHLHPVGLPLYQEDKELIRIPTDVLQTLQDTICPLVVRNEREQQQFGGIFYKVFQQTLADINHSLDPAVVTQADLNHSLDLAVVTQLKSSSPIQWKPLLNIAGLIAYVLMTGMWLFIGLSHQFDSPDVPPFNINYKSTSDWHTLNFFTDSIDKQRSDSIQWVFDTGSLSNRLSHQSVLSKDTVSFSYQSAGNYSVTAYRQTNFNSFVAWVRNYSDHVDTATITLSIKSPNTRVQPYKSPNNYIQPYKLPNTYLQPDSCKLSVEFKAVEGDTVILVNRSNGVKRGVRYRWAFDDTRTVVITADTIVKHRYNDITKVVHVILTPLLKGCLSLTITLPRISNQFIPEAQPQIQRITWRPWAFSAFLAVLSILFWLRRKRGRQLKNLQSESINDQPPFQLRLPDQQSVIRPSPSLLLWARQLRENQASQRLTLSIPQTIRATVRQAGFPNFRFLPTSQRPAYLVLVDTLSVRDQQSRLYRYLTDWLVHNEVSIELFLFHTDPRYCWNTKHSNGISIKEIAYAYGDRQLIIFTDGLHLLDYSSQDVAQWVKIALNRWIDRSAILTPIYAEHWNEVEKLLSKFFVILPATPEGQLRLRANMERRSRPTFSQLRAQFGLHKLSDQERGFFEKTVDEVTRTEIDTFLQQSVSKSNTHNTYTHLRWWAYATAVYPTTDWAVTLRIGHALEEALKPERPLVTTDNLLNLTALPWLKQGKLTPKLSQELLTELPGEQAQTARKAVEELLQSKELDHLPMDSIANQERLIRLNEQRAYSPDKTIRQQALRALESSEQAGLVNDKQIIHQFKKQRRILKMYKRLLVVALIALMSLPILLDQALQEQLQRTYHVFFLHQDIVNSALFSPDGTQILTSSWDKTAKLWDLQGTLLATMPHQDIVSSAIFSPNGNRILTTSDDKTAKLWDLQGTLLATMPHQDIVSSAVFSPNGNRILTSSWDKTAKLWDLQGTLLATMPHQDIVNSALFSPDGNRILTSSWDKTAKLWDLQGTLLATMPHQDIVSSAVFSPNGNRILTTSDDKTAKLWDLQGTLLATMPHQDIVSSAVFSPNGNRILTSSWDKTAKLWDLQGTLLATMPHQDIVSSAVFSPNGNRILTTSDDKTAKLWDLQGTLLTTMPHQSAVNSAVFSPNRNRILTTSDDKTAKLWDLQGTLLTTMPYQSAVSSAVFSPNGNLILTSSWDKTAKLWDLYTTE